MENKKIPRPDEVPGNVNIQKILWEMIRKYERLNEVRDLVQEKQASYFIEPEYKITWRQEALDAEIQRIVNSKVIRKLFMSERELRRKVRREQNYYTRLQEARLQDEQDAERLRKEDEERYEEYRNTRMRALAEKESLEKECREYAELYRLCASYADTVRILCDDLRSYSEMEIIKYMIGFSSFDDDTPRTYLQKCMERCKEVQRMRDERRARGEFVY